MKTVKVGTVRDLMAAFNDFLPQICNHVYVMRHQYTQFQNLKKSCGEDECVMVIDFSKNYNCKSAAEVQSAHFGCSNLQVSLHTGAIYKKDTMISFCTESDFI